MTDIDIVVATAVRLLTLAGNCAVPMGIVGYVTWRWMR